MFNLLKPKCSCKDNEINICKKLIKSDKNKFILELYICIEVYTCPLRSATTTVDSMHGSLAQNNQVNILTLTLQGEGCNGAQVSISPDRKSFECFFPAFFTSNTANNTEASSANKCCKINITLESNNFLKFKTDDLNITINGQTILDSNSCSNVLINNKTTTHIKGPFANNYVSLARIKMKFVKCNLKTLLIRIKEYLKHCIN